MNRLSSLALHALWMAATAAISFALWAVFIYAPEERVMGAAQKIFYFHVPSAFVTYASVAVMLGASIAYLWKRDLKWDALSLAATEVAVVFCTIVLVTGPIWAKPAWNTWWTWEARLISTLVLWVLLVVCLMLRGYAENRELGARLAAIVGIVAAIDVPIIHKAVEWWRGQHPEVFRGEGGIDSEMAVAFGVSSAAFFLLMGLLISLRYRTARLEDRATELADRLADAGEV
jgi:heme exporter protein C